MQSYPLGTKSMIATGWKDYKILATADGQKLETWKDVCLLRPDPQVIWKGKIDEKRAHAVYARSSSGGGEWKYQRKIPAEWTVEWEDLKFLIKPMGFKHVGLFPEQSINWAIMRNLIKKSKEEVNVLNLFAYTGGATVACAKAGAKVTHVDAAKGMVERAGQNATLSNVPKDRIRYIIDDCKKFVQREIKRGKKYNALIMDPPSYGRGPGGELWKIEESLYDLVELTINVLENPIFYLINSYTTGLQPSVIENVMRLNLKGFGGSFDSYEVCLPTEEGIVLPCGCSGLWQK